MPDAQLPKYQIKFTDPNRELNGSFNPFIGCKDRVDDTTNKLLSSYKSKLDKIKYAKEYEKIMEKNKQEEMTLLFDKINTLYITEESKNLLKNPSRR